MQPNEWWCCLSEPEANVVHTLVSYFNTFTLPYYPQILWDALWLPLWPNAGLRQTAIMTVFEWSYEEIIIDPEDPPLKVVQFNNLVVMVDLAVYSETPAATCPDGCTHPVWP